MTDGNPAPRMQFMADAPQPVPRDIRMEGFAGRASVSEAIAWVDRHAKIREAERVALSAAVGRFLAEPFVSPADGPPTDTAVSDRSEEHTSEL